ncbi:MAG: type II toxin-antitoxin system VapB family antitoxin [Vicinamibacterales bacterium]
MRTTLDLPTGLVEAARDAVGFKSKTDTVVFALKEVVRRSRLDDLKALVRRLDFEFDPADVRRLDRTRA